MAKTANIKYYRSAITKSELNQIDQGKLFWKRLTANKNQLESTIRDLNKWSPTKVGSCENKINFHQLVDELDPIDYINPIESSIDKIFDNLSYAYSDFKYINTFKVLNLFAVSKHITRQERIETINEELRILKLELRKKFSKDLLLKVKELVQELHSIVLYYCKKQFKHVNRIRIALLVLNIRDIRNFLRQTIQIIFKNLNDFSGCEEEARINKILKTNLVFLFHNYKNHVRHKIFSECN